MSVVLGHGRSWIDQWRPGPKRVLVQGVFISHSSCACILFDDYNSPAVGIDNSPAVGVDNSPAVGA